MVWRRIRGYKNMIFEQESRIYKDNVLGDEFASIKNYFWTDDEGAHITQMPRADFEDNPSGGNQLLTSVGNLLRDGLKVLAAFTSAGLTFLTPNGVPAIQIESASGSSTQEIKYYFSNEKVPTTRTEYPVADLANVTSGDDIYFTAVLFANGYADTHTFSMFEKGSSDTDSYTFTSGGKTITLDVEYDGATSFYLTASSATSSLKAIPADVTYYKSAPAPKISVGGKTLTDGVVFCESKFLVWENQSPGSAFNPNVDSPITIADEVDALEIVYRFSTNASQNYLLRQRIEPETESLLNCVGIQSNNNGGRTIEFTNGKLYVNQGYWNGSTNNNYAIPQKIYGVTYI